MGTVTYIGTTTAKLTNGQDYHLVAVGMNSTSGAGVVVLDNTGSFSAIPNYLDFTVVELFGTRKVV